MRLADRFVVWENTGDRLAAVQPHHLDEVAGRRRGGRRGPHQRHPGGAGVVQVGLRAGKTDGGHVHRAAGRLSLVPTAAGGGFQPVLGGLPEPGARQFQVARHAVTRLVELADVEAGARHAAGRGGCVPGGRLAGIMGDPAAGIVHDCHVQLRFRQAELGGAPVEGKGPHGVGWLVLAQIRIDRLGENLLGAPGARGTCGKRGEHPHQHGCSRPCRELPGCHAPCCGTAGSAAMQRYFQVISARLLWLSCGLPGLAGSVAPLARIWNRSAGMPRATSAR